MGGGDAIVPGIGSEVKAVGRGKIRDGDGIKIHSAFVQLLKVFLLIAICCKELHKVAVIGAR